MGKSCHQRWKGEIRQNKEYGNNDDNFKKRLVLPSSV